LLGLEALYLGSRLLALYVGRNSCLRLDLVFVNICATLISLAVCSVSVTSSH